MNPDPVRQAYDQMARTYDKAIAVNAYYSGRVARFLRRHWKPGLRVLDLGCGTGLMTRNLPDQDVIGLDLSPNMLAMARTARPNRTFAVHDYHQPVPESFGKFDVALCISSLEFCHDLQLLFRNLAGALKPGGVALATPVHRATGAAQRELASPRFPGLYLYSYSPREVEDAVAAAGFLPLEAELGRGWRSGQRVFMYRYQQLRRP